MKEIQGRCLGTSRPEEVCEVVGPVTVLAAPVYNPDDDTYLLFGTLPNGSPVAIEELAQAQEHDGTPVSLFQHLSPGDVIICAAATRADSFGRWVSSWNGKYQVVGEVYQLDDGKAIDLVLKMYEELDRLFEETSVA